MYLVVIQLFKNEYQEDLFMAISSAGIYRTTYCDSINLDKELQGSVSLFSGLFKSDNEKSRYAKIYFCIAEEEGQVDAIVEGFEIAGIDWKKEEIFQISVIPVAKTYTP